MSTLQEVAKSALSTAYSGPIRRASERAGLHPTIFSIHLRIQEVAKMIDHRRAPNPYPVELPGASARFDVSARTEYNRVSSFLDEEPVIETIVAELEDDDVYWDVGANIGTHAFLPAAAHPTASVVAIEPYHRNVTKLIRNRALNDLDNVSILPLALSDRSGTAELRGENDQPGYGAFSLAGESDVEVVEVPVRPGDELIADGIPAPSVVKIDVEGGELAVLEGLEKTLSGGTVRTVFCEVHRHEGVSEDAVTNRLREYGYAVTPIAERGPALFVRADRR